VSPRRSLFPILTEIAVSLAFGAMIYGIWTKMSLLFHSVFVCVSVGAVLALIYQLSGTQIIEFDSRRLTICNEFHGWERKKEFRLEDCSELEWAEGSEGRPAGLKCKVGWRTVTVGEDLSEAEAIEVLTALQRTLPDVAQKICSYPEGKEHFLTLGLGKQK